MNADSFVRTRMLLGDEAMSRLADSHVAVFGIGGVGGYVVEALARSGIGHLSLFDDDVVSQSNLNRQIYALNSTIGKAKVEVAAERIYDINPACQVECHRLFYLPENAVDVDLKQYDYVVDCIDTITGKLELVRRCHTLNVPILSCMGAARKMDASAMRAGWLTETSMDPIAKVMRRTLRKEGIKDVKVVFSDEKPLTGHSVHVEEETAVPVQRPGTPKKHIPASNAFVPATMGLIAAGEIIKDIIAWNS